MVLPLYSFPTYDPEVHQQWSNFSQLIISSLRLYRHHPYGHNDHHNCDRYHLHYYYYFCIIVTATSGEEGRKSIMKEIGLGKELGDSSPKNVVKFIGCVTTQSKKPVLYILSCLLFEIRTSPIRLCFLFVLVFCLGKNKY